MNSTLLLPDRETLYQAVVEKDPAYDGLFYTAVTTTGIFCRPTCSARRPKLENVVFYAGTGEALEAGYRPCRLCRPLEPPGAAPAAIRQLLSELEADPALAVGDQDLRARGLEPATVRRWFKKSHGLTLQAYARALRVGAAHESIRRGETATQAAFASGYDSLSGFGEACCKVLGAAPTRVAQDVLGLARLETPLGPMLAGASDSGLCLLEFADCEVEAQLARLAKAFRARLVPARNPHFELVARELQAYFAGQLRVFGTPLDFRRGTDFQRRVWAGLTSIPYGATRSYAEQARLLGEPRAVRAVARTNGDNPIVILVPCHRVVGSDGSLTGYGGGLWRKRWLLDLESAQL